VMTTRGYGPRPDTTNPTTEADPNLPEDGNKPLMRGAKSARDPEDPLQGPATKRVKMEHDDDPSPVQMPQSVATPLPRHWAFADQPPTPPPEKPVNRGQEKILESLGMHVRSRANDPALAPFAMWPCRLTCSYRDFRDSRESRNIRRQTRLARLSGLRRNSANVRVHVEAALGIRREDVGMERSRRAKHNPSPQNGPPRQPRQVRP